MEGSGLGLFMISASLFGTLLEHPDSPLHQSIGSPMLRRALMGVAMGLTAIAIVYSPWGKQSGAHINPSVTMTFFRLGKIKRWDAFFYVCAQFAGGIGGVLLASILLGDRLAHPSVNYVATVPGAGGPLVAFAGEVVITFLLMTVVLNMTAAGQYARYTGILVGLLVATYITVEAPLSGMSMNPARTFWSAAAAQNFTSLWVYLTAPLVGMLAAAQVHLMRSKNPRIACAKLHHQNSKRCIHCGANMKEAVTEISNPKS